MTLVDAIGTTGAVLTTVCWLPQAIQILPGSGGERENAVASAASVVALVGMAATPAR